MSTLENFKSKSFKLKEALNSLPQLQAAGVTISHAQLLELVSQTHGFSSFSALSSRLSVSGPCVCPHCGSIGKLKKTASEVFVEAGEYLEEEGQFACESEASQYECEQCGRGFVDYFASEEELKSQQDMEED